MTGDTFEALLAPNLQSVRRFVQTRLKAADHTDDVIQQTLLNAFAHRHQLRASSKFKSWLCSIAMNEVRMFFRTDRNGLSLDEFPNIDSRDSAPSPLARLEQMERVEWLQAGMARLSERDRATIRLRDIDGLSLTETAEVFRSSEAAAKSLIFGLAGAWRMLSVTRAAAGRLIGPPRELRNDRPCAPDSTASLPGTARRQPPGDLFRGVAGSGGLGLMQSGASVRRWRDLYYLSACSQGSIARIVLADVAGHGEVVSSAAVHLREALRRHIDLWDQSVLIRDLNDWFLKDDCEGKFARRCWQVSRLRRAIFYTPTPAICRLCGTALRLRNGVF
ncbi:MAG: sigma-70 family RNA polymerase sigma factor [Ignavibacteriota bacterium]